ncbi:MAG: hypothetical protein KUG55_00645 [Cycloclasticus sp.]|nr:hypothetical protein [Cycloclasticus sp.]
MHLLKISWPGIPAFSNIESTLHDRPEVQLDPEQATLYRQSYDELWALLFPTLMTPTLIDH